MRPRPPGCLQNEAMDTARKSPGRIQPLRGSGPEPSRQADIPAGSLVGGRYLVEHILGQGGMGAVYFARDRQDSNLPVALKVLHLRVSEPQQYQQAVEQFRHEANLLASLSHEGLAKVIHYFVEQDRYYLVMTYLDGKNLADILQDHGGPLPVSLVVDWANQLLNILEYLHGCNPPVIFRDLKPGNLILTRDGRLHLVDFGIARVLADGSTTCNFLQGLGSPDYCPLEQYQGGGTDQRSDLYALGATLYHLLTFRPPPLAAEVAMAGRPVCSPRRYNPQVNSPLEELVVKLLQLRKEDRFSSVKEVRTALLKSSGGQKPRRTRSSQTRPMPPAHSTSSIVLAALSVLMLALLAWLGFKMQSPGTKSHPSLKKSSTAQRAQHSG